MSQLDNPLVPFVMTAKKRAFYVGLIILSLITLVGVWAAIDGDPEGWWIALIGAFFLVITILGMFNVGKIWLKLDSKGFTKANLWGEEFISWDDIDYFRRTKVGKSWSITYCTKPKSVGDTATLMIFSVNGMIQNVFGMSDQELIELLERYRKAYKAHDIGEDNAN